MGGVPSFEVELVDGHERDPVADQVRRRARLGVRSSDAVVIRHVERRAPVIPTGRHRGVRVGTAAVFAFHHAAVGGQLVAADAEQGAQRAGQRDVETAVRGTPGGWRGPWPTPDRTHPRASVRRPRGGPPGRAPGGGPARPHRPARRVRDRRWTCDRRPGRGSSGGVAQQVTGAEVAGLDTLIPRHPLRRQQRRRAGHQHGFADGRRGRYRGSRPPRRPTASPDNRAARPGTGGWPRSGRRTPRPGTRRRCRRR